VFEWDLLEALRDVDFVLIPKHFEPITDICERFDIEVSWVHEVLMELTKDNKTVRVFEYGLAGQLDKKYYASLSNAEKFSEQFLLFNVDGIKYVAEGDLIYALMEFGFEFVPKGAERFRDICMRNEILYAWENGIIITQGDITVTVENIDENNAVLSNGAQKSDPIFWRFIVDTNYVYEDELLSALIDLGFELDYNPPGETGYIIDVDTTISFKQEFLEDPKAELFKFRIPEAGNDPSKVMIFIDYHEIGKDIAPVNNVAVFWPGEIDRMGKDIFCAPVSGLEMGQSHYYKIIILVDGTATSIILSY